MTGVPLRWPVGVSEAGERMIPVLAAHTWPTNAHLIEDVAKLGYLDGHVLDCTYGLGVFWRRWQPEKLTGTDLDPAKSPTGTSVDFTALPFSDGTFDAVVFDPPYKLNGTPDPAEERFGTHEATRWQDRIDLMICGLAECARVVRPSGYVLAKCQDQVCSGQVRWQTDILTEAGRAKCLDKIDRFDMLGTGRPQPDGRRQVHARHRPSSLLVFRRGLTPPADASY